MTPLEIAIHALEEIRDADFSFEGHACLHCETAMEALAEIKREQYLVEPQREAPAVPMLLWCPSGHRHIDEGIFADKLHHTHACQTCGIVWRPAIVNTVGVQFLPGFKNADPCEICGTVHEGCCCGLSDCGYCGTGYVITEKGKAALS